MEFTRRLDESLGVITLVGTERDAMAAGHLAEHLYRRLPLGPAGRG